MSNAYAIGKIYSERIRQITQEGWNEEHDDKHTDGELARAAAVYAVPANHRTQAMLFSTWPFDDSWLKLTPDDREKELVKAGALIVAELERLARTKFPKYVLCRGPLNQKAHSNFPYLEAPAKVLGQDIQVVNLQEHEVYNVSFQNEQKATWRKEYCIPCDSLGNPLK